MNEYNLEFVGCWACSIRWLTKVGSTDVYSELNCVPCDPRVRVRRNDYLIEITGVPLVYQTLVLLYVAGTDSSGEIVVSRQIDQPCLGVYAGARRSHDYLQVLDVDAVSGNVCHPNFLSARSRDELTGCLSNVRTGISQALSEPEGERRDRCREYHNDGDHQDDTDKGGHPTSVFVHNIVMCSVSKCTSHGRTIRA